MGDVNQSCISYSVLRFGGAKMLIRVIVFECDTANESTLFLSLM